ncbi:MAG: HIT domain-containing protein [Planctomycetota bacterium]
MEALWAPWRMEFIQGHEEGEECIFCVKPRQQDRLRQNLVLTRGPHAFVILNRYPYNNGHLMVIPNRHTAALESLEQAEILEIHSLLGHSIEALRSEYRADGFNVGMNLGRVAGAGITGHLHYHLVPRWTGDTNFMPVLGETKSLPEHLLKTYDRLAPHYR